MKISEGILSLNLPDKLSNFTFFTKDPYAIFYQNNFINEDAYNKFADDVEIFIKSNNLQKSHTNSKKKIKIDGIHNIFNYKIEKSSLINNFLKILYSKEFYNWFKKTHLIFYGEGIFGSVLPKSKFQNSLLKAINFFGKKIFKKKFFSIHSLSVEFSDIEKGALINPHTDSFKKRMALVFYVPSPSITIDEFKKNSWGTVFWKVKSPNQKKTTWQTTHQNKDNINEFLESYEVAVKVPYKANSINGFIKNDNSWHSVDLNKLPQPRRAIVINIFEYSSTLEDIPTMNLLQKNIYDNIKSEQL